MIRYRVSRMTREPRTTQKEAAWQVMEEAYMAASGDRRHCLPWRGKSTIKRVPRSWR